MRLKIGHSYGIARTLGGPAAAASAGVAGATAATPGTLLDIFPLISGIKPGNDPLPITITIPPYSLSTHNELESVTAIVVPRGTTPPPDAEGWMALPFPMQTIQLEPGTTATLPVTPPSPTVAAVIASTTATALAVTAAASTVTPTAVASTLPPPTPTYLPGPSGGSATFEVPGVPAGLMQIQLIENYVN